MTVPSPQSILSSTPSLQIEKLGKIDLTKLGLKRPIHRLKVTHPAFSPALSSLAAAPTVLAAPVLAAPVPVKNQNVAQDRTTPPTPVDGPLKIGQSRALVKFKAALRRKRRNEFDIVLEDWAALYFFRHSRWEPDPVEFGSLYRGGFRRSRRVSERFLLTAA
jgi:hypothetical protein